MVLGHKGAWGGVKELLIKTMITRRLILPLNSDLMVHWVTRSFSVCFFVIQKLFVIVTFSRHIVEQMVSLIGWVSLNLCLRVCLTKSTLWGVQPSHMKELMQNLTVEEPFFGYGAFRYILFLLCEKGLLLLLLMTLMKVTQNQTWLWAKHGFGGWILHIQLKNTCFRPWICDFVSFIHTLHFNSLQGWLMACFFPLDDYGHEHVLAASQDTMNSCLSAKAPLCLISWWVYTEGKEKERKKWNQVAVTGGRFRIYLCQYLLEAQLESASVYCSLVQNMHYNYKSFCVPERRVLLWTE